MVRYAYYVLYAENSSWWKVALLIYCFYAIGSSLTLSLADIKVAGKGIVVFVVFLLIFNMLTFWIGNFTQNAFVWTTYYLSWFYFMMLLCLLANIGFTVLMFCIYCGRLLRAK